MIMIDYLGKGLEPHSCSGHSSQNPRVAMGDMFDFSIDPILFEYDPITSLELNIVDIKRVNRRYKLKMLRVPSVLAVRSPTVGVKY